MFLVNKIFGEEAEEKADYEEGPKPLTLPDVAEYIQRLYFRNFFNSKIKRILSDKNNQEVLKELDNLLRKQKELEDELKWYEEQKENWREYYAKLFRLQKNFMDDIIKRNDLESLLLEILDNTSKKFVKFRGLVRLNKKLMERGEERRNQLDATKSSLEELLDGREDKDEILQQILGSGKVEDILNRELAVAYSREQRYEKDYRGVLKERRSILQRKYQCMEKYDDYTEELVSFQNYVKEADKFLEKEESRGNFFDSVLPDDEEEMQMRNDLFNKRRPSEKDIKDAIVVKRNVLFDILFENKCDLAVYEDPGQEDEEDLYYLYKQGITMYNNFHVVPWYNDQITLMNVYDIFMVLTMETKSIVNQTILTDKLLAFYMFSATYDTMIAMELEKHGKDYYTFSVLFSKVSNFLKAWVFDTRYKELNSFYKKVDRLGFNVDYVDNLVRYFINHMDEYMNEVITLLEIKKVYFSSGEGKNVAIAEQPMSLKLKF